MKNRLSQAWQVFRHGLPVVNVKYVRRTTGEARGVVETVITYVGKVEGTIDGQHLWSDNGTFNIEQPIGVVLDMGEKAP